MAKGPIWQAPCSLTCVYMYCAAAPVIEKSLNYVFMTFCMSQNFKDKQPLVAKITTFVPKTVLIVMVSACMDIPCT